MGRIFNMPRRITDQRRKSKDGYLALAAWLGIKFAFGNSTLYDISVNNLQKFYHLRRDRAKYLLKLMWEDSELFYVNKEKNCVFAKSCRDKVGKVSRIGERMRSDDVITIDVPECYLRDKDEKEFLELNVLVRMIECALVCKEYDDQSRYKYSGSDPKGCERICATDERKSQLYVARRTGLSRTKVGRILRGLVAKGFVTREPARVVRAKKGERYSFEAVNKLTRLPYWAKCVPVKFGLTDGITFKFRNIIWNCKKRLCCKFLKSAKAIENEIRKAAGGMLSERDIQFQAMVRRQTQMRDLYD